MCGIVGWLQRDGAPIDPAVLLRMTALLAHRGPDGSGTWDEGAIGLGHRRLAIRDLSALGRQPLSDAAGRITISYNGEIYNDAELRRELERDHGVAFRSTCDAETIPYAYLAWGERAFDRLEGMFAIALWDRDQRVLHLARDGIGIKPLYWAEAGRAVLFASEAKAILAHPAVRRDLDPEGLHALLATGHAGPDASVWAGLHQVPPGSVLSFTAGRSALRRFWAPRRQPDIGTMDDAVDALGATLREVVESQVVADVPLGVLQSGGIDSTLVTLTAARCARQTPIFTAAFQDSSYDETDAAIAVAQAAGRPHHIVPMDGRVQGDEAAEEIFRSVAWHTDGQCADTGLLAFWHLAEGVRRHTTVVLSGDGGDEFFAGYDTYAATRAAARLGGALSGPLLRPLYAAGGRALYAAFPGTETRLPKVAMAGRFLLGLGAGDASPHLQWRRLVPRPLLPALYGPAMAGLARQSPYRAYQAAFDADAGDLLDRALVADQCYHLPSVLMKVDTMSMAHGLEVRVPLLDRRVMDLAGRMSLDLLRPRRGPGKRVLRTLAARLGAPPAVTAGSKKGFNVPIAALMRGNLARLGDELLDRDADILAPYVDPDGLRHLWRAHRDRTANHAFALWPLFLLAAYMAPNHTPAAAGRRCNSCSPFGAVARPEGLEPPTRGLEGRRSIHLS